MQCFNYVHINHLGNNTGVMEKLWHDYQGKKNNNILWLNGFIGSCST